LGAVATAAIYLQVCFIVGCFLGCFWGYQFRTRNRDIPLDNLLDNRDAIGVADERQGTLALPPDNDKAAKKSA